MIERKFTDLIYQEIDFIGQLFVEFEQLAAYEDVLTSRDNRESLVSLFRDFADRVVQLGAAKWPDLKPPDRCKKLLDATAFARFQPYLHLHQMYAFARSVLADSPDVDNLFRDFPEACQMVVGCLRSQTEGEN
ncbi:MAG: hypothetical protein Kow0037_22120 [Calditrichia bacterium]